MGIAGAAGLALILAQIASLAIPGAGVSGDDHVTDPEVLALVGSGRARVLVVLRVADSDTAVHRSRAIGQAQDAVLSRLPHSHASVVRRYTSIPVLALEIDATALLALYGMPDLVVAVKSDRAVPPQ